MSSTVRLFLGLGGLSAMLSVLIGAFGAHALRGSLAPDLLAVYQTGVQYQFYHSLGVLIVALLVAHFPERSGFVCAGWTMIAGIVLFSGSLYTLSLTGIRSFGAVTPVGGVTLIVAWAILTVTALRTA